MPFSWMTRPGACSSGEFDLMNPYKRVLADLAVLHVQTEPDDLFETFLKLGQSAGLRVAALQGRDDTDVPIIFVLFDQNREFVAPHFKYSTRPVRE